MSKIWLYRPKSAKKCRIAKPGTISNGPINGKPVILEAKIKNTSPAFRSDVYAEVDSVTRQSGKTGKDWIYVIRDYSGREFAICELDFFAEATEEFFRVEKP
jgi:hypothetical protein